MQQTQIIMGMPITITIHDEDSKSLIEDCFNYFRSVDERYSTYNSDSEISQINNGLPKTEWSQEMKTVLNLCEETRKETEGYFDISHNGKLDPSGIVKGWAINNAANTLKRQHVKDFCIEAGGDIQVRGEDKDGPWIIGIRNPFKFDEIIKRLIVKTEGVATSGTYFRGQHVYDPHNKHAKLDKVKSLTVVAKNIYEADRFATAAFAMGMKGIEFIKVAAGLEGYMIVDGGVATFTSGFERYVVDA